MSLYVEVMCDVRKPGNDPADPFTHFCWSDRNANPQGGTVAEAKAEARRFGWHIGHGRRAKCPNCATLVGSGSRLANADQKQIDEAEHG